MMSPSMGGEAFDRLRPATVWMDVTTSWRKHRRPTDGTLRIEQSYAAALRDVMPERLRLCRYHATRRRFIPVAELPNDGPPPQMARPKIGRASCRERVEMSGGGGASKKKRSIIRRR